MRPEHIRKIWLLIVALLGAVVVAYFRSMSFGSSARDLAFELGFALVVVLPLAAPSLVRVRPDQAVRQGALALFASLFLGESWCLAEEWMVHRDLGPCDPSSAALVRDRWWPFDAHYVFCTPGGGWRAGD